MGDVDAHATNIKIELIINIPFILLFLLEINILWIHPRAKVNYRGGAMTT